MKRIEVAVTFSGTVTVDVPEYLSDADSKLLASKFVLASMLATDDNSDCGEALDAAFGEFFNGSSIAAEDSASEAFDAAGIVDIAGVWSLRQDPAPSPPDVLLSATSGDSIIGEVAAAVLPASTELPPA